jgi:hypothetical protein
MGHFDTVLGRAAKRRGPGPAKPGRGPGVRKG